MQAPSRTSSSSNEMSESADNVGGEEETLPIFAEAKEEFEFWVGVYEDHLRD